MQIEVLNPNPPVDPPRKGGTAAPRDDFDQRLDQAIDRIDAAAATEESEKRQRPDTDDGAPQGDVTGKVVLAKDATGGAIEADTVPMDRAMATVSVGPGESNIAAPAWPVVTVAEGPEQPAASRPLTAVPVEPTIIPANQSTAPDAPTVDAAGSIDPVLVITSELAIGGSKVPSAEPEIAPEIAPAIAPEIVATTEPTGPAMQKAEIGKSKPTPVDVLPAPVVPEAVDTLAVGRRAELNRRLDPQLGELRGQGVGAEVRAAAIGLAQGSLGAVLGAALGQSAQPNSAQAFGLKALFEGTPPAQPVAPAAAPAMAPAAQAALAAAPAPEPVADMLANLAPTAGATPATGPAGTAHPLAAQHAASQQPAVQQVAVHITRAADRGVDRIRIQLTPPELGRVDVRLELSHEGRVQVLISADRTETLDLLRRDALALERALADAGLDADADSLRFAERGDEGGEGFNADASADETGDQADPDGMPGGAIEGRWLAAANALDIRV